MELSSSVLKAVASNYSTIDLTKIQHMSDSKLISLISLIYHPIKTQALAITIFNTINVCDDFNELDSSTQSQTIVHELKHVEQFKKLNIAYPILYIFGNVFWLLSGLLLTILLLSIHTHPLLVILCIISSLFLSTTGLIFPHAKAFFESSAYRNGDKYYDRYDELLKSDPSQAREQIAERYNGIFKGSFYFWMGGIFATQIFIEPLINSIIHHRTHYINLL